MTYREWFDAHARRHEAVVAKLLDRGYDSTRIIAYFDFDNMVEAEPDFCPLYAQRKKCHAMETLNCYLCACPHFRFNDAGVGTEEGKTRFSSCDIHARGGQPAVYGDMIHHDCTHCTLPHETAFILQHFDTAWKRIMQHCETGPRPS